MGNTSSISKLCVEWSKDRFRDPRTGGKLNVDDLQYKKYEAACMNILNDRIQATKGDKQEIMDQLDKMCYDTTDAILMMPYSELYDTGEFRDIVFIGNENSEGKKFCFMLDPLVESMNIDRAAGREIMNPITRKPLSDADKERIKAVFKVKIIKLIEKCGQEEGDVQIKEELKGYLRRFPELKDDVEVRELLVNTCLKDVPVISSSELHLRFRTAVSTGNLELIENIVRLGFNLDPYKNNSLIIACKLNHLEIVKFLVEHGADVHYEDETPLRIAIMNGYFEIVKFLAENEADIHIDNDSLLVSASLYGHFDIFQFLIEKGLSAARGLIPACENGDLEMVKFTFENDIVDNHLKNYCLEIASEQGDLEIVKFLVEKGVDISANNYEALKLADENSYFEVAEFLREKMELQ